MNQPTKQNWKIKKEKALVKYSFKKFSTISIILIWITSAFIVGFFSYSFLKNKKEDMMVAVKGVESSRRELAFTEKKTNINFEQLIQDIPDAPQKKSTAGTFYTRSKSAIVIDAKTHTILHDQNGKMRTAIASLTKMMTAIIVVENIKKLEEEIVMIDKEMVAVEGTKIGCPRTGYCVSNTLQVGEKISAQSLLEAMLMNSANDAAIALAKHIAGSQEEFAQLMNKKVKEIGLEDTHFCNPSGLDDESHPGGCYSSAYDLARIVAYSFQYDKIWKIMKIKEKDVIAENMNLIHHILNTDILIDQLPNCLGGKTGFTYEAGKSLMMAAHHPQNTENRVVSVLIDNPYRWQDMPELINWIFQAYDWPPKSLIK